MKLNKSSDCLTLNNHWLIPSTDQVLKFAYVFVLIVMHDSMKKLISRKAGSIYFSYH